MNLRTFTNKAGVEFDAENTDVLYAEDMNEVNTRLLKLRLAGVIGFASSEIIDFDDDFLHFINIDSYSEITEVNFSSLVNVSKRVTINSMANLTSVDLSLLESCTDFQIESNPLLTFLDISSLVPTGEIYIDSNESLETFSHPASWAINNLNASECALNETTVNGILMAIDAGGLEGGTVDFSGGTNAAPTGAGLTAKSNLEGKGWDVYVNP